MVHWSNNNGYQNNQSGGNWGQGGTPLDTGDTPEEKAKFNKKQSSGVSYNNQGQATLFSNTGFKQNKSQWRKPPKMMDLNTPKSKPEQSYWDWTMGILSDDITLSVGTASIYTGYNIYYQTQPILSSFKQGAIIAGIIYGGKQLYYLVLYLST